jgi:hypothetical protein
MAGPWRGGERPRWVRSPVRLPDAIGAGGWVRCACEDMVKLKSYNNWTRIQRRGEDGTHRSGGRRGGAGSIELGGGKREWPRPVWRRRELERSFYRRPGRGRG